MRVESLLPEKIPLISSSFTHTPKVAPIVLRILRTQENISFAGQKDLIRVLLTALTDLSVKQRTKEPIGIEMASTEDGNLGTTTGTVATAAASASDPFQSSSTNSNASKGGGRSNNCKRQKFCSLAETTNRGGGDLEDPIEAPDLETDKSVRDSEESQHQNQSSTVEKALAQAQAPSVPVLDSSSNCGNSKSPQKIGGYENDLYIAPEQALVTSVELVVPAPQTTAVRHSEEPCSVSVGDSSLINSNKLHYSSGALYSATGSSNSTRILASDKIDGCVNDSSNLNVRIPTNLALAAATGDILLADRRASIWAPHDDEQVQATTPETTAPDDTKQGSVNVVPELPYRTVHQQRHSELLLQIEKDGSGAVEVLPLALQHNHDNSTQVQYGQQQLLDSQLQGNMYAHMMQQQQHHHHQHQQIIHDQNSRHQQHASYSSYNPHFQHSELFGAHQTSDHHRQQQPQLPHHMECHGHLHQSAHIVQQQQQQQMHEAYHDLIMDDFHEDPSSAYKLTLSPGNVKPENQDDGYETSAGDVLTPNSHSSSTHSVTPQHQIQHPNIGLMQQSQNKTEELVSSQSTVAVTAAGPPASSTNGNQAQAPSSLPHLSMTHSQSVNSRGSSNANAAGVDPYSFMGEEMRMLSPVSHHIEDVASNTASYAAVPAPISVPSGNAECSRGDIYQHQHPHSQQNLHNSDPCNDTDKVESNDNSLCGLPSKPTPKKRGRKKKLITEGDAMHMSASGSQQGNCATNSGCDDATGDSLLGMKPKERKKHDRFNGMSEAEVIKRTIPDHLCENLDIVIVGINPGLFAAYKGHHYAGPGNHFWKCLYLAGLTQEQMSADEDHKLLNHGIGFTNMVARATKGSADLTRKEIKEGSRILLEKLQRFRPKVAVFNGKLIFEVFSGKKEFHFGRQPDRVDGTDTYIWVMPSSSARCAQLPRAADKVPFYAALKKFRDFLNGLIPNIDESECVFTDQRIRQCSEQQQQQQHQQQTDVNSTIQPHVDQQASLIFVDGGGGGGCGSEGGSVEGPSQMSEKLLPRMTPNVPSPNSINERGTFAYTGGDNTIRNNLNTTTIGENSYLFGHQQALPQQPQEKKKRGRPKKVKGQEMNDPSTGSKITLSSQQMAHHDFNNIMNLSMIAGGSNPEIPKKKRGRPKKLKPTMDNIIPPKQQQHQHTNTNTNSQSVGLSAMHPLSMEHIASSPQSNHQMPPSLYNTPPPSHILYTASASPMASPALNCNYTQVHGQGTPPVGQSASAAHGTPPILDQQTDHMISQKQSQPMGMGIGIRDQPHLGETPPPNSPNMCTVVDFDQPEDNSEGRGREQTHGQAHEQGLGMGQQRTQVVDKAQYVSPGHEPDANAVHSQDHYQQWIPPHTHQGQKPILQQIHQHPQPLQYHQEPSEHWHRYEDQNPYLLISPHQHQLEQSPQLGNMQCQNTSTSVQVGSDVARKSLSGLESLVDQIPAIREHESSTIPPATAAAAAAAVESRLLGLQQQQQQQQQKRCHQDNTVQVESGRSANDGSSVLNNNFSVSNLAASAATADNVAVYTSRADNRCSSESSNNNHNNCSTSNEYAIHSPTGYPHHATHLITSALGATINSPEPHPHPHPHPHTHPHPQMYMDHAHISSHMAHMSPVNVNSVYAPTAYGSHPQHSTGVPGEYATTHGHYGLGSPVQATAPGSTTLHVPSPNYPYAHHPYSHTPPQANYPTYGHPHTHHSHPTHHLSVFDRLKPSDISGYGGF